LAQAYDNRGLSYAAKQDYGSAIRDYSKAIELAPANVEPYFHRGYAYIRQRQYELAILDYSDAIRLDAEDAAAYDRRCWVRAAYVGTELQLAREDCAVAIRLVPKEATVHD